MFCLLRFVSVTRQRTPHLTRACTRTCAPIVLRPRIAHFSSPTKTPSQSLSNSGSSISKKKKKKSSSSGGGGSDGNKSVVSGGNSSSSNNDKKIPSYSEMENDDKKIPVLSKDDSENKKIPSNNESHHHSNNDDNQGHSDNDDFLLAPQFEDELMLSFEDTTSCEIVERARTLASNEGCLDQAISITVQLIEREKKAIAAGSAGSAGAGGSAGNGATGSGAGNGATGATGNGATGSTTTLGTLFNNLAVMYERQGRLDAASKCLTEALARAPLDPSVYSNLGVVLQRTGRSDAAVQMLAKALQMDSARTLTRYRLAKVHMRRGEFNAGKALLMECVRMDPLFLRPYADLSIALSQRTTRDDWEMALKLARELVRIAPEGEIMALHTGTYVLTRLGRYSEALELFETGKTRFPGDALLHMNCSLVKEHFGDAKGALVDAHRAYEIDNTSPDALFLLARMLHANKRPTEAEQLLQGLLDEHPTHVHSYLTLMHILLEQERFHDAFALLDTAIKKYPTELAQPLEMYRQYVVAMQLGVDKE